MAERELNSKTRELSFVDVGITSAYTDDGVEAIASKVSGDEPKEQVSRTKLLRMTAHVSPRSRPCRMRTPPKRHLISRDHHHSPSPNHHHHQPCHIVDRDALGIRPVQGLCSTYTATPFVSGKATLLSHGRSRLFNKGKGSAALYPSQAPRSPLPATSLPRAAWTQR